MRLPWHGGHGRRPRGGAEPVPREGDLGERPGLGQSGGGPGAGRLVEPRRRPPSSASPTAQARGRAADWHGSRLRGQPVSPSPVRRRKREGRARHAAAAGRRQVGGGGGSTSW